MDDIDKMWEEYNHTGSLLYTLNALKEECKSHGPLCFGCPLLDREKMTCDCNVPITWNIEQ